MVEVDSTHVCSAYMNMYSFDPRFMDSQMANFLFSGNEAKNPVKTLAVAACRGSERIPKYIEALTEYQPPKIDRQSLPPNRYFPENKVSEMLTPVFQALPLYYRSSIISQEDLYKDMTHLRTRAVFPAKVVLPALNPEADDPDTQEAKRKAKGKFRG